jgi:DNA-binding XRE family transcriptional regulator
MQLKRWNLILARLCCNYSQAKLGNMIGVTRQAICLLESGRSNGRMSTWGKLERILGYPQDLLYEIGVKPLDKNHIKPY